MFDYFSACICISVIQQNDKYKTELLELELFDHLPLCKQMTDV